MKRAFSANLGMSSNEISTPDDFNNMMTDNTYLETKAKGKYQPKS